MSPPERACQRCLTDRILGWQITSEGGVKIYVMKSSEAAKFKDGQSFEFFKAGSYSEDVMSCAYLNTRNNYYDLPTDEYLVVGVKCHSTSGCNFKEKIMFSTEPFPSSDSSSASSATLSAASALAAVAIGLAVAQHN